ncbi:MAG TPA: transporter [Xanthobacteraceae bacterium]|nr:transporter [Xanthobacteraceae bacterium]
MTSKSMKSTAACLVAGSIVGWHAPAMAGSDNSSDTYAGDYSAGSLPTGTFIALQYLGFAHSNAFINTAGNQLPNSHANIWEEFTRFAYFTQLGGHPFIIEAELPFATLTNVNLPGTNSLVQGGLADPVVHLTYYFISDAQTQRWLGFTNYLYMPFGNYDNTKAINVATAHQFTDVPQIGYTEGLEKFSPGLKGFFVDLIANASIHTDGNGPINLGVVSYDTLTQRPSYDVKAFLRYEPTTFSFVALGIEKSWGGEQVATNGRFAVPLPLPQPPNLSLTKDDFLRGHLQFQFPLARDFAVAADVFHDFARVGGFRDDIGAEIRLTKFFFPQPPLK